ncbi:MAG: exodeoxyribonuclease I, partial [Haemophilus parainfluenzae]|nr:exodeoxyribonuclease I [Haemophilus parainfluenzae]
MANNFSFFIYDYESFGINPASDRPAQFAGIRTDADFNIIGEPVMLYCKQTNDYLPA